MTVSALEVADFLNKSKHELIVDVRAPIEFFKGHVPYAINIPLFEDSERAEIGTLYKQQGKDTAVNRGLEIVSPKMTSFVNKVKALSKNKKVFVYCFRGGMRSNSFAWLMNTSGLDAVIMKGGYKAFRNYVLDYFEQERKIILLGGKTGSGKTDILKKLNEQNLQIVDLEGIAHHKGSAFGAINEQKQNPQQVFEHQLYHQLSELDRSQYVILEDESQTIGFNKLPHSLWQQMKQAPIVKIEIPFELRVQKLVEDYTTVDINALKACVGKIAQQLGTLNTKLCLQYLDDKNLSDVARLSLLYYDRAYEFNYKNKKQPIIHLNSDTIDATINAQKVKQMIDTLN
ncbi:MAG: tRNA 2-selenouridine(34) synthase MnmH [Sphingobacteriaceae bacterium]|nr:tRNA 2-selenouridine(34) synthase MnmH [Sphingobacteriaceae bacterium]